MDQQVSQDVFLCLDGEALIVCIGVIDELRVEIGPDGASNLASELKNAEATVLIASLSVLELMDVVLVLLGNYTL